MKMLRMSWNTEEGRLVCRWVESEEHMDDSAWIRLARSGTSDGGMTQFPSRVFAARVQTALFGIMPIAGLKT